MIARLLALAVIALGSAAAIASPDAADVAEIVGTWRGTARWTGCSVAGNAKVAVPIAWRDGAYVIDLAGAREDLGEILLAPDGDVFTGHRDDLQVRFAPRGAPTLTLTSSADCTARLTLARPTSGIAACDRLVALASIEAACPAAGDHRGDRQAALVSRAAGWPRLRGARQRAAAASCTADAETLGDTLIATGCAPTADGALVGAAPACDAYLATLAAYLRCPRLPSAARRTLEDGAREMMRGVRQAQDPAALERAGQVCASFDAALRESARQMACRL